jgi:hypothetical protein
MADFDEVYSVPKTYKKSEEEFPPFVGSYVPITPAGQDGPFLVNTYYLRPDRKAELGGPVSIREHQLRCN